MAAQLPDGHSLELVRVYPRPAMNKIWPPVIPPPNSSQHLGTLYDGNLNVVGGEGFLSRRQACAIGDLVAVGVENLF